MKLVHRGIGKVCKQGEKRTEKIKTPANFFIIINWSVLHHSAIYNLGISMFFLDGDIKIDITIRPYCST